VAEIVEVGVLDEPTGVVVAEPDGLVERSERFIHAIQQGVTTGKIVEHERIVSAESRQTLVDVESLFPLSHPGVGIAQNLQRLDEIRVASGDPLEEPDFKLQVFFSGGLAPWRFGFADRQHGDQFLWFTRWCRGEDR
jgi:hypothetical protein